MDEHFVALNCEGVSISVWWALRIGWLVGLFSGIFCLFCMVWAKESQSAFTASNQVLSNHVTFVKLY